MPSVSGRFTRWELRILRRAIRCDTRWQIRATIWGVALGYLTCLSVLLWEVGEPGGSNKWIVRAIVGIVLISSVGTTRIVVMLLLGVIKKLLVLLDGMHVNPILERSDEQLDDTARQRVKDTRHQKFGEV